MKKIMIAISLGFASLLLCEQRVHAYQMAPNGAYDVGTNDAVSNCSGCVNLMNGTISEEGFTMTPMKGANNADNTGIVAGSKNAPVGGRNSLGYTPWDSGVESPESSQSESTVFTGVDAVEHNEEQ